MGTWRGENLLFDGVTSQVYTSSVDSDVTYTWCELILRVNYVCTLGEVQMKLKLNCDALFICTPSDLQCPLFNVNML